jgi:hypothetical protein
VGIEKRETTDRKPDHNLADPFAIAVKVTEPAKDVNRRGEHVRLRLVWR